MALVDKAEAPSGPLAKPDANFGNPFFDINPPSKAEAELLLKGRSGFTPVDVTLANRTASAIWREVAAPS
jgi:hypothetical protein